MIYTLHHSTGTLLLSANDRGQVVEWARRQLGQRAENASITELPRTDAGDFVEKDGTGITAREAVGCHPVLSIMANIAQDVFGEQGSSGRHGDALHGNRWSVMKTTWH